MHLESDYLHPTPHGGRCRVRIFLSEVRRNAPVIVMSEPKRPRGMLLEACVEKVAAEVIHHYDFSDQLMPIFVEHHESDDRFWLVTFEGERIELREENKVIHRSLGIPQRKELDRRSVEILVGRRV